MNLTENLIHKAETYGAHNYHPLPLVLRKGHAAEVVDVDGNRYLDFLSCYSALNFGHQHPVLVKALLDQLEKLAVCSRAFYAEEFGYFSEELAKFTGLEMVLAMNSGAEACETAIKIARKWGYEKKRVAHDQANIICFENNFHGRTVTIVSFSTDPEYRDGFGPFTPGFKIVPFNDPQAVENVIDKNTVGIFIEPIQAEAGILIPDRGYLKKLRNICDRNNILLMVDEIQTGLGRTGSDFCFQHDGIQPDLLILGKSLGGGLLPISAVVGNKSVMEVIRPGQHGSTFGGNPLACAVARA
ncbi:ornithine--oxo-acid transaminase, partial [bacterium]|nr:ornithine--oxo-acid transaminase [bacterium]